MKFKLTFTACIIALFATAQPEPGDEYFALIPSNVYWSVQTGITVPSFQDLKSSDLQYLGVSFPVKANIGFENDKISTSFNLAFYSGSVSPLNGSEISLYNFRPTASFNFLKTMKNIKVKNNEWKWRTGIDIRSFYDLRRNTILENNENSELLATNLGWSNSFERTIKIGKGDFKLKANFNLPLVGLIGESQSFAYNAPQSSFRNGIFNYTTYNPSIVKHQDIVPIGKLVSLQSDWSIEKTFENENRKWVLGLHYNWDYFRYNKVKSYPLQMANHQVLISVKKYFFKLNPEL